MNTIYDFQSDLKLRPFEILHLILLQQDGHFEKSNSAVVLHTNSKKKSKGFGQHFGKVLGHTLGQISVTVRDKVLIQVILYAISPEKIIHK
jgi:hypothetical protein